MRVECASRTDVGLKRKVNEDSLLAAPERSLWAVADGMGGHEAGEVASAMVVEALGRLAPSEDLDHLADEAVASLRHVNGELIDLARARDLDRTIGTTVVGLALAGESYRCFWAGDSRAYLLRDGMIRRLTRDHSLVQTLVDSGMIKPEEADRHENSNVITRAVGVSETLEVDIVSGDARPGDRFMLASDGLTRVVDDQEIAAELERGSPADAAERLVQTVLARGAPDNVTIVILRLA
jgi:serine/threonine protein phosphatase PrpC